MGHCCHCGHVLWQAKSVTSIGVTVNYSLKSFNFKSLRVHLGAAKKFWFCNESAFWHWTLASKSFNTTWIRFPKHMRYCHLRLDLSICTCWNRCLWVLFLQAWANKGLITDSSVSCICDYVWFLECMFKYSGPDEIVCSLILPYDRRRHAINWNGT